MPVVCLLVSVGSAFAQHRVDRLNMYQRVIAIVPMVGQGTEADPRRPLYAPTASAVASGAASLASAASANVGSPSAAILGYTMVESDDGMFALVELVALNQSAFQTILADSTIQTFLKGRDSRQAAEAAFQKLKKGFSIATFGVRMVP